MNRKQTAWKKNRRLGDVAGGRSWPKLKDGLIRRTHSLKPPAQGRTLPILIEDNPSRAFFFPITGREAIAHLASFPPEDVSGLTHVWLRRLNKSDYATGKLPLAEYVRGSGAAAIVLYPWPKDRLLRFDRKRPPKRILKRFLRWDPELICENGVWHIRWSDEALRDFYLNELIGHEIGHHRDGRRISKANRRRCEESAEQYALTWMPPRGLVASETFSSTTTE